ncbi:hypothetical protein [Spirilliplanes yamanashiensis]|uniref:Uncharacterized protein n=1 Tax=Spirilliplanes yamanashiensis TaxID=42233 RepID=A0A8J3Y8X3_9ACTN|nr:hypothetical protein [Spirilliplanes yamanashiensis]MDP9815828.1 hypothetical protein [Spirilliplanes yamanashiensis]GIJ04083.1 hypothetical protein Sya03_34350 [Spirilliplanes yamanashiensis]
MTVFGCRTCGAALTVPLSRVALPVHTHQKYGNGPGSLDPLLEHGTFAVDPLPSGAPWRLWPEPRPDISAGTVGRVLLAPGDVRGAALDPALADDVACCGLNGDEPNMVCTTCGTPVATRIDDCGLWQAVWLDPLSTHVIEDGPGPHPVLGWTELLDQRSGVPPSLPDGSWHPIWPAAVAAALAHLLAASGGDPILIPDHRVADVFRHTLDSLAVPAGRRPARSLVLAGPGLAAPADDLALVPEHPQTGEQWPVAQPVTPIPLAWDAWRHLATRRDAKPVGRSVTTAPEALPALLPGQRLRPDGVIFFRVLARLPEVRQPWLRAIYDRGHPFHYTFF